MSSSGDERVIDECEEMTSRPINRSRLLVIPRPETDEGRVDDQVLEEDPFSDDDIPDKYKRAKYTCFDIFQWACLALITLGLICTFILPYLKNHQFKGFSLWKWEILAVALICGRLICSWVIRIVVLLIQRNFLLRKRVLYFVYGLRNPVQNCLWLGIGLLMWHALFGKGEKTNEFLKILSRILICLFVGTLIRLVKTLCVKVLASMFHVSRYFDRIQESLFNQYVIEALMGPPKFENIRVSSEEDDCVPVRKTSWPKSGKYFEMQRDGEIFGSGSSGIKGWLERKKQKCYRKFTKLEKDVDIEKGGCEDVDLESTKEKLPKLLQKTESLIERERIMLERLDRMSSKNVSAWSMKRLIKLIRRGFVYTLDEQILDSSRKDETTQKIESEFQAKIAANKIFRNVAEQQSKFIHVEDVKRFMREDQALKTMSLIAGSAKVDKFSKALLKNWVVNALKERRALALTLDDTKTAVNTLHQMVNILVSIIIAITCLLILQILTTNSLLAINSFVIMATFIFGNSCKNVFEAIIFLFFIHPFDIGDRCEIDGLQMVVEEINITSTIFRRFDQQKIIYPNITLFTKPIGNYYRSPDMGDTIDFYVHVATPAEVISDMRKRIISYIESKKEYWNSSPKVMLMNMEDLAKVKYSVWLTHRMNYQDMTERHTRRAFVVEEMIKIFNDLDIDYRFTPGDVNIRSMPNISSF